MDKDKYVDESWKETAAEEKEKLDNITKKEAGSKDMNQETEKEQPAETSQPQQQEPASQPQENQQEPETSSGLNFINYITSLGYQAMIFLGEVPHPVTNETEKNIEQSKFLIDTLILIREKTKGNLTKQEDDLLNASIYELQMKYVESSKKETEQ